MGAVAKQTTWLKLDNAGKIFPGQNTSKWSNIFRITAVLKEAVDPKILERALRGTLPRFPCFDVRIRRGFFWYYFEKNPNIAPPVMPDIKNPCYRVNFRENDGFLFRVYYRENRISIDFYHALSDAYGASRLLSTITAQYLRLCGNHIPAGGSVLSVDEPASPDELEDAYRRYANSKGKRKRGDGLVYHTGGTRMPPHTMNITTGFMPIDKIKSKAAERGVSVTEFLAAALLYVHYEKQKNERRRQKPIVVQIPVNLRNVFPSETLRNFSLWYSVGIDPKMGEYTFDDVLRQVSLSLRLSHNEKNLNAMITANMRIESNPAMRLLPLFVKDPIIALTFAVSRELTSTAVVSNLGIIKVPSEMERLVDKIILVNCPGVRNGGRCAVVSFKDTLAATFSNIFAESDIEREFFRMFDKMGIPVKIESNRA